MERNYAVSALGEMLIDFVPHGKDDNGDKIFAAKTGGAPANLLAAVSSAGFKTGMIGMVGNDMFGRQIIDEISKYGVDTSNVIVSDSYNTTLAFVSLDETGDRDFSFFRENNVCMVCPIIVTNANQRKIILLKQGNVEAKEEGFLSIKV